MDALCTQLSVPPFLSFHCLISKLPLVNLTVKSKKRIVDPSVGKNPFWRWASLSAPSWYSSVLWNWKIPPCRSLKGKPRTPGSWTAATPARLFLLQIRPNEAKWIQKVLHVFTYSKYEGFFSLLATNFGALCWTQDITQVVALKHKKRFFIHLFIHHLFFHVAAQSGMDAVFMWIQTASKEASPVPFEASASFSTWHNGVWQSLKKGRVQQRPRHEAVRRHFPPLFVRLDKKNGT